MSRHQIARAQTLATQLRPAMHAVATIATCAVAAWAGALL